ncbi:SusC/RagA family TonB-linked outer membrane protein [Puia sp.]|uniref:SusC/RagA family TonB-linked outer membrane protein n=1 Tax=Puia sp. TaxID=2045100 RepID=UPI002F40829E
MERSFFRVLLLVIGMGLCSPDLRAQQVGTGSVSGIVRNDQGDPVSGVTVVATNLSTGSSAGTQTDTAGVFRFPKLIASGKYSFVFSSVGFQTQTLSGYSVKGDGSISILVKMKGQANALNEVVVVGYGTQKRANVTGAVSQVSGEVLDRRSLPNITQGLEGTIPNLNLIPADGKPISSAQYNIRGATSIGQGGNALVLVDGVQADPALLNPNDVASVTVLKDASSSAIYGARAAFGVVLITTKQPLKGKPTLNYSSNYSIKTPLSVPDIVSNGYQYAKGFDSAWTAWNDYSQTPQNINKTQPFSNAYMQAYAEHDANPSLPKTEVVNGNYVYYGNTNWFDLLYKKHNAAIDQNLSLSGGSGKTSYYVSGRYSGQDGLFRYNSDNYHMYNFLARGSIELLPWLQVDNTTQFTSRYYHNPLNVEEGGGIWRNIADEGHPSSMLLNPDGSLTYSSASTVGDFYYGKNGINLNSQVIRNTTGFTAKFFKNRFRVKGDLTFQNTDSNSVQTRVQLPYSVSPGVTAFVGTNYNDIQDATNNTKYLATNLYAEYEQTFGDHYFKALAGYNYEQSTFNSVIAARNGLAYSNVTNINLALGQNITTIGNYDKWAILGGFGRLNYSFKDRYLLELDGRYDGSSKFPTDQRYAFFPSASAGWRISKEAFWNVDPKAVSDLKIRGSYGSLGNGSINSYLFQENFKIQQSLRVINGVRPQETSQPNVLPDGLTWETATMKDLGLDLSALNNRLQVTGDIYQRMTTNMFTVGKTLPSIFGTTVPKGNYANMRTNGFEASVSWHDQFQAGRKAFHYTVSAWISDYVSVITKYNNLTKNLKDYYVGEHLGEIWGYVNDGYWTDANYKQAYASQSIFHASNSGQWLPGDVKFKNINAKNDNGQQPIVNNGDNTATNPGDMKIIGNSSPRYSYGFNLGADWNNFFIGAFFHGVAKRDWWPGGEADNFWGQYNRPYNNLMKYQVGKIWSPSNPNAYFPRLRGYVAQNSAGELYNPQTKYLQNASFIRLKNLQVGYNLPGGLVQRAHLTAVRVYLSAENLWTYTPMFKLTHNVDPESIGGSDPVLGTNNAGTYSSSGNTNNYPFLKSYTLGLSVTL